MKKLLLLTVVFVFAVSAAHAADATATGHADAEIIAPITVAESTHLNFGRLASPTEGSGTVVVSAAASPSVTRTGVQEVGGGTAASAGAFTVTNTASLPYSAAVSPASISVTSSTNSMTVNAFSLSCASNCTDATLYVGGTLSVAQNQAAGNYTGTFTLTLTY